MVGAHTNADLKNAHISPFVEDGEALDIWLKFEACSGVSAKPLEWSVAYCVSGFPTGRLIPEISHC